MSATGILLCSLMLSEQIKTFSILRASHSTDSKAMSQVLLVFLLSSIHCKLPGCVVN